MRDKAGRVIDYLRLSITEECDLRCRYCQPEGEITYPAELTLDDFLFVIRVASTLGIRRVRLTGGEPLRRAGLPDFIQSVAAIPGIDDVSLTTNGVLLAEMATVLKDKGLNRVNISLDSLQPERYAYMTRGGVLHKVLAGVTAALSAKLTPVKINCVVIRGFNDDEVEAFAALTWRQDIAVRFLELMSFGEGSNFAPEALVPIQEIKKRLGPLIAAEEVGAGPAKVFRLPGAQGTLGFISGTSEYFCRGCNRLRITAQGKVRSCLFADAEGDIRELIVTRREEALRRALEQAVTTKPEREKSIDNRRMAEIGG
ncbi:MAG: GTP 3',8-cyclase MoaA [Thermaerobacter sp.]|nr:GTP 3',8-cyclase MoaA [Thermaerobacter sp.]